MGFKQVSFVESRLGGPLIGGSTVKHGANLFHCLAANSRMVAGETGEQEADGLSGFPRQTVVAPRLVFVQFLHYYPRYDQHRLTNTWESG